MKFEVIIHPDAEAEMIEAFDYIRARSPMNANRWLRGLYNSIASLETLPNRCALAREDAAFAEEIRQLLYGKRPHQRRILFTIRNREVHVLHIRHGARQAMDE